MNVMHGSADDTFDHLDEARSRILEDGELDPPSTPWSHPAAPPDDVTLVRMALWSANQHVGSGTDGTLRAALELLPSARAELDGLESALLFVARAEGMTWQQIAERMGLRSPQAAQQRYQRLEHRPGTENGTGTRTTSTTPPPFRPVETSHD